MHCRWYPCMFCRSPVGVVSQHALQVSRPTSKGEVEGSGLRGCLQAHIQGGLQAHIWGILQAHTGGVSRPTPGGDIPACTEADPAQQTATAAGGTHLTGMHPCLQIISVHVNLEYCSYCVHFPIPINIKQRKQI